MHLPGPVEQNPALKDYDHTVAEVIIDGHIYIYIILCMYIYIDDCIIYDIYIYDYIIYVCMIYIYIHNDNIDNRKNKSKQQKTQRCLLLRCPTRRSVKDVPGNIRVGTHHC